MPHDEVQRVLDWADGKVVTGDATPLGLPNHFKLRETLELIVSGMEVTTREGDSAECMKHEAHKAMGM
jgi:hypothetical protein